MLVLPWRCLSVNCISKHRKGQPVQWNSGEHFQPCGWSHLTIWTLHRQNFLYWVMERGWNESLGTEIISISTPKFECLNLEVELHPSLTYLPFWKLTQQNFLCLLTHIKGMRRNVYILCEEGTYITNIHKHTKCIAANVMSVKLLMGQTCEIKNKEPVCLTRIFHAC